MSTVQAHIQRRLHDSGQYCLTQHDARPVLEGDECCRSVADGSGGGIIDRGEHVNLHGHLHCHIQVYLGH